MILVDPFQLRISYNPVKIPEEGTMTILFPLMYFRKAGGNDAEFDHTGVRVSSKDEAVARVFRKTRRSQVKPHCAGVFADFT